MSDEMIIRHCSPTLAGMKTGNAFSCSYADKKEVISAVRSLNRRLAGLSALLEKMEWNISEASSWLWQMSFGKQLYFVNKNIIIIIRKKFCFSLHSC